MSWTLAPALRTLLAEVNALYPGRDKRTDGTISGYPGARSSHNYNSEGYVCALDITTGDYLGGISTAQGQALAEQVRLALKVQPRGIPAYPIHYMAPPYVPTPGPYIATAGTDWEWEPYGYPGSDPHTSHLHVSVDWDIYTGGAPSGLADYLTEMSWNLGSTTGQDSGITPIMEGLFMALTDKEQKDIYYELCMPGGRAARAKRVADEILNRPIASAGAMKGRQTSLGLMVAWNDDHVIQTLAAVAAAAASDGATVDQIKDAVKTSIAESVVKVAVTVDTAGGAQ